MILVTGANGFVGTALCRSLVASGAGVRDAMRRGFVYLRCVTQRYGT